MKIQVLFIFLQHIYFFDIVYIYILPCQTGLQESLCPFVPPEPKNRRHILKKQCLCLLAGATWRLHPFFCKGNQFWLFGHLQGTKFFQYKKSCHMLRQPTGPPTASLHHDPASNQSDLGKICMCIHVVVLS